MKKIVLLAAICFTTASYAQTAKVTSADNMLLLQKYDEAKANIDEALANEKSNTKPKTFIVAASVYSKLAAEGKDSEGVNKAKTYIEKAIELDQKGDAKGKGIGKSQKDINNALQTTFFQNAVNAGIRGFDEQNYKLAKTSFATALWAKQTAMGDAYKAVDDSTIIYNTAIAALQDEDWKMGVEYFEKSVEVDYEGPMSVLRANYCLQQLGDSASMESLLHKGFEKYPNSKDILTTLIQFYLSAQRNEEALVYLNQAITKDPENAQFYFARGCLNEKINKDDAIADYNTALSKNPNLFNALYNLGVVYYNMGVDLVAEANDLYGTRERDAAKKAAINKEADAKTKLSVEMFKKALDPMLKAVDNADNVDNKRNTLDTIKTIYYRLGEYEKSQEYADKIKAL